jgi:hypothetical protein
MFERAAPDLIEVTYDDGFASRPTSRSAAEADVAACEVGNAVLSTTMLFSLESVAEWESATLLRTTFELVAPELIEAAYDDGFASRPTSLPAAEAEVAAYEEASAFVSTTMLFEPESVAECEPVALLRSISDKAAADLIELAYDDEFVSRSASRSAVDAEVVA